MKRYATSALLIVAILAVSSPLPGDDDHNSAHKTARADGSATGASFSQAEASVTVKLFQYQPRRTAIKAGTTVTWVNEDEILHTVTAESGGGFDAALDGKGKRFSFTFTQPGTYSYHCDRHKHMRGEIDVH